MKSTVNYPQNFVPFGTNENPFLPPLGANATQKEEKFCEDFLLWVQIIATIRAEYRMQIIDNVIYRTDDDFSLALQISKGRQHRKREILITDKDKIWNYIKGNFGEGQPFTSTQLSKMVTDCNVQGYMTILYDEEKLIRLDTRKCYKKYQINPDYDGI